MADGKGFGVIVKINLPPEKQYHQGHSVIFQGDTAEDVQALIAPLVGDEQAKFVLLRFAEFALGGAVEQAMTSGVREEVPTGEQAPKGASPAPDLASKAVLAAVAKKTGKSVEELGELTKDEAQKLLKGGGK